MTDFGDVPERIKLDLREISSVDLAKLFSLVPKAKLDGIVSELANATTAAELRAVFVRTTIDVLKLIAKWA